MNKNELISAMSGASNLNQTQCTEALQTFINTVTAELKKGSDVKIIGFGTFKISEVATSLNAMSPTHSHKDIST